MSNRIVDSTSRISDHTKHPTIAKGPVGIETVWEMIGPDRAEEYLAKNIPNNRRMMNRVVSKLEKDLTDDQWITTHEGIAFDVDGWLIDGQHRLKSIINSGVSIWLLVTRNLPKNSIEFINRGKTRTLAHALQVLGYEHAGHRFVAVARAMFGGPMGQSWKTVTDGTIRLFIDKHLEALAFSLDACPQTTGSAPAAAVVARAYYHYSAESIRRFCDAMADHIPPEEAQPIDKVARKAKKINDDLNKFGGVQRTIIYRKIQSALVSYMNGQVIDKIYEHDEDMLPIPEDKK